MKGVQAPHAIAGVVDLSIPVTEDTPTYSGDPVPSICQASTIARDGFNVTSLELGSHTGTHCDAPLHFDEDGSPIDELDLSLFIGQGVIVDVTGKAPRAEIDEADLSPWASQLGPGVIVLLRTGWSEHGGTPRYFEHPFLGAGACQLLLDAGVRTIGIDAINIDPTPSGAIDRDAFPCHAKISAAGGVIVENLANLGAVTAPSPLISLLPLRITGCDGSPIRAVALELEGPS
jgi:kynurenine formamidase